jgi:hypothetical protein
VIVKTKTNFAGEVVFEIESPTLRKVLAALSNKSGLPISFDGKEVRGDFRVYLNGLEYDNYSDGIDTPVKEADKVEVSLVILAGG